MKTANPIKGLVQFYFYAQSGNILGILAVSLVLSALAVITGIQLIYNVSIMIAIGGAPYLVVMGMGSKEYSKWERFRVAMPIKRGELAGTQYLAILLASLVGLPIAALVAVLTYTIHGVGTTMAMSVANVLPILAMPLMFAGFVFPFCSTKFGENKQELVVSICLAASVALITILMPRLGNFAELIDSAVAIATLVFAIVVFVVSYCIQRTMYAKKDF